MTDGARARYAREQAPWELADLVTFLASSRSRDGTSTTVLVDGDLVRSVR